MVKAIKYILYFKQLKTNLKVVFIDLNKNIFKISLSGDNRHGECWGTQNFFCLSLHWLHSSHISRVPQVLEPQGRDSSNKVPSSVSEDEVWDYLINLNIQKSMGLHKMHPRPWGNWLMQLPNHSPWYLKGRGSQVETPIAEKREA